MNKETEDPEYDDPQIIDNPDPEDPEGDGPEIINDEEHDDPFEFPDPDED